MAVDQFTADQVVFNNKVSLGACIICLGILAIADVLLKSVHQKYLQNLTEARLIYQVSCIASDIHAVVVCFIAVYALLFEDQLRADPCWGNSMFATVACSITIGYMFADSIYMACNWKLIGEWSFVFHHSITIAAYLCVTNKGVFQYLAMIRLLAELSTPFVNMRATLFDLGLKKGHAYYYNGLLMLGSFTISRIVPLPYYLHLLYTITGTEPFVSTGVGQYLVFASTVVLDTLNIKWFHKMLSGAIKVWKQHHSSDEKLPSKQT